MQLFKDSSLKIQLADTLDFGELMAGQNKIYTFYVYNDSLALLRDVKFSVSHKELEILSAPATMKSHESAELRIKWAPSLTLKQGLKTTLTYTAVEVWIP